MMVGLCLDQLYSLLTSTFDLVIEVLRISSETSIGIYITVFFSIYPLIEIAIPSCLGLGNCLVEDSYFISIQYLNTSSTEFREFVIVELPILILEVTKAFAVTYALLLSHLIYTLAAILAIGHLF